MGATVLVSVCDLCGAAADLEVAEVHVVDAQRPTESALQVLPAQVALRPRLPAPGGAAAAAAPGHEGYGGRVGPGRRLRHQPAPRLVQHSAEGVVQLRGGGAPPRLPLPPSASQLLRRRLHRTLVLEVDARRRHRRRRRRRLRVVLALLRDLVHHPAAVVGDAGRQQDVGGALCGRHGVRRRAQVARLGGAVQRGRGRALVRVGAPRDAPPPPLLRLGRRHRRALVVWGQQVNSGSTGATTNLSLAHADQGKIRKNKNICILFYLFSLFLYHDEVCTIILVCKI